MISLGIFSGMLFITLSTEKPQFLSCNNCLSSSVVLIVLSKTVDDSFIRQNKNILLSFFRSLKPKF
jgi:hypothetical protein